MSIRELSLSSHAVHFYGEESGLVQAVSTYLEDGLARHETAILIASPLHTRAFLDALVGSGIDLQPLRDEGRLVTLDAAETLARFMVDGTPDADAFDAVIGGLIRETETGGRRIVAYGEMVAILWEEGNVAGAIELERLWNGLLERRSFSLLCAYPLSSIDEDDAAALEEVCGLHSSVEGARGESSAQQAFAAEPESARAARRFASETLIRWGCSSLVDDAVIVVSELATNAIIHARSDFNVMLSSRAGVVRVAVRDDEAHTVPSVQPSQASPTSGRGMLMVDALASRWGVEADEAGKVVWVELASGQARSA